MDTVKHADDLKIIIKQLFLEKKKVQQLQAKLTQEQVGHRNSSQLKEQIAQQEQTISVLQSQLEKTKPALKQLFDQLKEAKEQLNTLPPPPDESEIEAKETAYQAALHEIDLVKQELSRVREAAGKELGRFESERSRLVEKLAESLSQHQRQSETVKDLHEEINRLRQNNLELKDHLQKGQDDLQKLIEQKSLDTQKLQDLKEANQALTQREETLMSKLSFMEARLSESDIAAIHEDYAGKMQVQNEQIQNLKLELNALRQTVSEKEREINQAQHHLAKKVKEVTLLQDFSEEQKEKVSLLEQNVAKVTAELEQAKHTQLLQLKEEEKLRHRFEEKQERVNELTMDLSRVNQELESLQKVKRQHDDMANKLAEMKSLLGRSFE